MFDAYGHVEGPRNSDIPEGLKTDPLERLLGLCRVIGLRYNITAFMGRWRCEVTTPDDWPADFFVDDRRTPRAFAHVNIADRADGLAGAMAMAISSLVRNGQQYRNMVRNDPQHAHLFADEQQASERE